MAKCSETLLSKKEGQHCGLEAMNFLINGSSIFLICFWCGHSRSYKLGSSAYILHCNAFRGAHLVWCLRMFAGACKLSYSACTSF